MDGSIKRSSIKSEVKNFVLRLLRLESIIIFVFTSIHPLTLKIKSVGHQKIFCEWKIKTNLTVTITHRPSIHNGKIQAKYKFKNFNYLNNNCSDEIHSCLRTFISNTARTATILNRDNTRRQCSKQYSRQCVETDQFWSLLRVNAQAANTRWNVSKGN